MPQYRKLFVKTVESLDVNDLPDDFTRLMWVLLPLGLDCEGRGLDYPGWIKSKLFPLRDDVTGEMITAAMDVFCRRGMAVRYEVDGRRYFYLPTFRDYQGDTKRESPSNIPAPQEHDLLTTNSRVSQEQVVIYSRLDADVDSDSDSDSDAEADAKASPAPPVFVSADPVETYRQMTGVKPNKTQVKNISSAVQDVRLWCDTVDHWLMHDWKAENIVGILELYGRGGPPFCKCRQNGAGPPGKPAGRYVPSDDELRAQGYTVR